MVPELYPHARNLIQMLLINPQEMMITAVDDNDGFCCCFPARELKLSNVQNAFTASFWPLRQMQ